MSTNTKTSINTYAQLEDVVHSLRGTSVTPPAVKVIPVMIFSLLVLYNLRSDDIAPWLPVVIALAPLLILSAIFKLQAKRQDKRDRQMEEDYIEPFLKTAEPQKMYLMTEDLYQLFKETFPFLDDPKDVYAYWYESDEEGVDDSDTKRTENLRFITLEEAEIHGETKKATSPTGEEYITAIIFEDSLTDNYRQGLYNVTHYFKY